MGMTLGPPIGKHRGAEPIGISLGQDAFAGSRISVLIPATMDDPTIRQAAFAMLRCRGGVPEEDGQDREAVGRRQFKLAPEAPHVAALHAIGDQRVDAQATGGDDRESGCRCDRARSRQRSFRCSRLGRGLEG